jgi:hypothetical protein
MGRKLPRQIGVMGYLRAIPALAQQFSAIPGSAWSQQVGDDEYSVAHITCPCGSICEVEVGCLAPCDGEYHDAAVSSAEGEVIDPANYRCQRYYLYGGTRVYVANSPHRPT